MLSESDIYRAAHLMLHQYGDDAEFEAGSWCNHGGLTPALDFYRIGSVPHRQVGWGGGEQINERTTPCTAEKFLFPLYQIGQSRAREPD
jgi:hypothetical protein